MWQLTFILILGVAAILTSILGWRLKEKSLTVIAIVALGVQMIFYFASFQTVLFLILFSNFFMLFVFASLIIIPVIFIIKSYDDKPVVTEEIDGPVINGQPTQEYLDNIINGPDEDLNLEDDYDL
ncbi:hypothetical protein K6119_04440 [Paracrocinitomix mangrovi]|uniref:hypothetical protein n=1 Tax=Paracrocinitomix mangrovi TaxID=2862509 RepID=UPI001C8DC6B2|nr:hypothetical protein [Paracrocinitomix mangrovi]UKN02763.1 hypothetical protein K6119_04440 [Paracrocinitomix mangrovi]